MLGQKVMLDPRHMPDTDPASRFFGQILTITDLSVTGRKVIITAEDREGSMVGSARNFMLVEPAGRDPKTLVGKTVILHPDLEGTRELGRSDFGIIDWDGHENNKRVADIRNGARSVPVRDLLYVRQIDGTFINCAVRRAKENFEGYDLALSRPGSTSRGEEFSP